MSVFDKIQQYAENAPEAFTGYGPSLQYGRLSMFPAIMDWKNKNEKGQPTRVPLADWISKNGEDLTGHTMELRFEVDIQEFNPNLSFSYSRAVRVEKNKVNINTKEIEKYTDWDVTVLPSLIAVFGKDWATECGDKYVEVIDESSQDKPYQKKVDGQPQFDEAGKPVMARVNTIKFTRVFKDKEACLAARNETYKSQGNSGEVVEGNASQIPAEIAAQAKSVIDQMGGVKNATDILKAAFPQYSIDALVTAANPLTN